MLNTSTLLNLNITYIQYVTIYFYCDTISHTISDLKKILILKVNLLTDKVSIYQTLYLKI